MVIRGALNLLEDFNVLVNGIVYDNTSVYPPAYQLIDTHYDYIFVVGTPWIWDQCHKTPKHAALRNLINTHNKSKVVFLGVGSCFCLGGHSRDVDASVFYGPNHYVIARDKEVLKYVPGELLPCPSFFSRPIPSNGNNKTVILNDMHQMLSSCCLNEQDIFRVEAEAMGFSPSWYYCEPHEAGYFDGSGKPINSIYQALEIYSHTKHLFTTRVHCAIPAFMAGCEVTFRALDTRGETFTHWKSREQVLGYEQRYHQIFEEIGLRKL
jgi:hypothetical protein